MAGGKASVRNGPPRHGPFARAVRRGGLWALVLTDEGREYLARHMERWPTPESYVVATLSQLYWQARRAGLTDLEIRSVACYGLVRAALHYDPARGLAFNSLAWHHVRSHLQRAIYGETQWGSWDVGEWSEGQVPVASEPEDPFEESDRAALLEPGLAALNDRARDMFRRRHGLHDGREWTLHAIAAVHGVSKERVRQILRDSLVKVRERCLRGKAVLS